MDEALTVPERSSFMPVPMKLDWETEAVPMNLSTELKPMPTEKEPVGLSVTSTLTAILSGPLPLVWVSFTSSK